MGKINFIISGDVSGIDISIHIVGLEVKKKKHRPNNQSSDHSHSNGKPKLKYLINGVEYDSIRIASRALGVSTGTVWHKCKNELDGYSIIDTK